MQIIECGPVETDESGKEMVTHGNQMFPLAIYHDHLETLSVDWHWHSELELIYQIDGEGLFLMNDQKVILKKGEGLFINSEVLHGCWCTEQHLSDICSMVFHPRLIAGSDGSVFSQKYLKPLMQNNAFTYCHFHGSEVIYAKEIRSIWELCINEPEGFEFSVRNRLSDLFFYLFRKQSNNRNVPSAKTLRNSERIKMMLNFIHSHYTDPIRISDIAASATLSESECLRCFRDTIQTAPGQYLKSYRVSRACEQLKYSSLSVRQIGELCGFSDESYFVKQFREAMGITPGAYRTMHSA